MAVSLMSAAAGFITHRRLIAQEEQRQIIKKKKQTKVNIGGLITPISVMFVVNLV